MVIVISYLGNTQGYWQVLNILFVGFNFSQFFNQQMANSICPALSLPVELILLGASIPN